jgi:hypothetical protein
MDLDWLVDIVDRTARTDKTPSARGYNKARDICCKLAGDDDDGPETANSGENNLGRTGSGPMHS